VKLAFDIAQRTYVHESFELSVHVEMPPFPCGVIISHATLSHFLTSATRNISLGLTSFTVQSRVTRKNRNFDESIVFVAESMDVILRLYCYRTVFVLSAFRSTD